MPKFPKRFEPNNLSDLIDIPNENGKYKYGFDGFINQLTALDPLKRPTA